MIKLVKDNIDIGLAFILAFLYTSSQFYGEHWSPTTTLKLKLTGFFMVLCYSFIGIYMVMYVVLFIAFWIFKKR